MNGTELAFMPAVDLAARIRRRELSPVEVVDLFLARIERLNPRLNAYVTLTADQARAEAREAEAAVVRDEPLGPLHGIPISIKDMILTRGVRTTRGSLLFEQFVPDEDAPVVERARAAGAISLGKTNTPEFGWKGVTDNRVFGATRNPWDLERTPGGSSGGASAQVAAGLGPLAIGTDGGGSVRIPCSFCGLYGLKPSFGRVPLYPASAAESLSHVGPMTRTVRDAALLLGVLVGPDERDRNSLPADATDWVAACDGELKGLRVAWSADLGYAPVEADVRAATEAAARRFEELGCEVEAADPVFESPGEIWAHFFYDAIATTFADRWDQVRGQLDPGLADKAERRLDTPAVEYLKAQFGRAALWDRVRRFFERYDLLLTPTMPLTAFGLGRNDPGEVAGVRIEGLDWSPFTYPFNLTGQPAATVPCGVDRAGLPIGLQIVGRRFADGLVLRASAAFEALVPWAQHVPEMARE